MIKLAAGVAFSFLFGKAVEEAFGERFWNLGILVGTVIYWGIIALANGRLIQ